MNQNLYNFIVNEKAHRALRHDYVDNGELAADYCARGVSDADRVADRFVKMMADEVPTIFEGQQIVFMRTVKKQPKIYTDAEWEEIGRKHKLHELGFVSNLTPLYGRTIARGLEAELETANEFQKKEIAAILDLTDRYCAEAKKQGREDIVEILTKIPRKGAETLREAMQFFRILHYSLWMEGTYHNTVGRFDLMMNPYYEADIKAGRLTKESALELIEDFFLSFNIDNDLYPGVQQGDNGQSLVLGGKTVDGGDSFSDFSRLCLIASRNLKVIDPKINVRVNKDTPLEVYELCTELTEAGLGFPQYSNDDIALPALLDLGYAYEDAVNYGMAACWEFIVPGVSHDIVNLDSLNFSKVVNSAIVAKIETAKTFDELMDYVREVIRFDVNRLVEHCYSARWFVPSPMMDMLSGEIKYNNYGIHGTAIASGTDSLAAVKKYVFDDKTVTPERLLHALGTNFNDDPELLHILRVEAPKMGNDIDWVDDISADLLDTFSAAFKGRKNVYGGIFRAGTGSAMNYLWQAAETGATADGRLRGEPFGTNFSCNLFSKIKGPVSVIRSFTKQHFDKVINGGPLTLEFSSLAFRDDESKKKVAELVRYFIQRGGHQLQLNAVNLETMKDAQIHPENHGHLVVRIWGWSAYFVELERDYQNHVIARQEYDV
ncbi:MAG: pyruvate formate-lyase [Clostridia bacterium]|nr:pyruvate formate-lyase [Clostridia bacterium]